MSKNKKSNQSQLEQDVKNIITKYGKELELSAYEIINFTSSENQKYNKKDIADTFKELLSGYEIRTCSRDGHRYYRVSRS